MPLSYVEEKFKELQKQAQKVTVSVTGNLGVLKSNKNKKKVKKAGKSELKSAKSAITKATSGLGNTVKGQFGTQVTEIMTHQATLLDNF